MIFALLSLSPRRHRRGRHAGDGGVHPPGHPHVPVARGPHPLRAVLLVVDGPGLVPRQLQHRDPQRVRVVDAVPGRVEVHHDQVAPARGSLLHHEEVQGTDRKRVR